ncbi:GDNF-inducible zinc finger protein 1-like isoform X2 [Zerene cesonia]|uniref:GDNF-inducible zinc finger protein 1-like isoform X2 n=1 Tax=Zerene cesonia TaxID=33412 RepID=UPI0018E4ED96|nr:GDNF-inducible zinc finger protein 1-like isoform X2 [Zerene cesonia]
MDWQLTCRVCLETGDMVSLFDWDENNDQLSDKYTYCCGVEVTKNDSLPTLICLNCVDRLTFAYQFKQQCLSSNSTLKECLDEFLKTSSLTGTSTNGGDSSSHVDTETITIKQENGLLLQYELPVEHDAQTQWTRRLIKTQDNAVVIKAPGPKKRGRPRKYPNQQGQIDVSPYQRKKPKEETKEPEALTTLLASGSLELKQEPDDENDEGLFELEGVDSDPDFVPEADAEEAAEDQDIIKADEPKKRGRPRKIKHQREIKVKEEDEDVLLKETLLAYSEPISDHILNPKPKKKKQPTKKKYVYAKTHVCETCGASFTSNASLQAHIRRHLGIKPFVCSVCGFSTVAKESLKRHMLKHTGQKPYACKHCPRRFADCGSRQKHERLHMGIRPYQCSLCGKAFTYSYVLANHMLTHTGEKKYSCSPCNKKFTKAHHLKYHNKVHHKELYLQQQIEQEAKKMRQQINVNNLTGVISGQIVDGTLQLIHTSEDGEHETQMQVVEDHEDSEQKETDRAVADMQAVVLDSEFAMDDEDSKGH